MRVHRRSFYLVLVAAALVVGVRWCVIHKVTAFRHVERAAGEQSILRASYPDWKSNRHHIFGDLEAVVDVFPVSLSGPGKPEELVACAVTAKFFERIGVEPIMGRAFEMGEGSLGHDHVVILSHRLWRRHFGSSAQAVGRNIELGGERYRVIGILPPDFTWNNRETDVWVPAAPATHREIQPAI
jgi:putative ABC transport system permease protein